MTKDKWDEEFQKLFLARWNKNGHRHREAWEYAGRKMTTKRGDRPAGPLSLFGLGFRIFWLVGVKRMDWRKLLIAGGGALIGGAAAALAAAAADGQVTGTEWWAIAAAGAAALGLYLKDPNAHKGKDPRQTPGVRNLLKK
jgi:peptidoglycan/LPS O-acetylase OafA/YrhL